MKESNKSKMELAKKIAQSPDENYDDESENDYTDNISSKEIDYDLLLSTAGEFGVYQFFLFFLTFPFYIFGVFSYFTQLFITEVSPNYWCWVPELENLTQIERRNLAIPKDPNAIFGYSQCEAYLANWSEVLSPDQHFNHSWTTESCKFGWEFNQTEIPYATISSELGWVCDRDSYQATAQSIYCVGSIVGGLVIGWVADRYGRIPGCVLSNLIGCIAGIATIFANNFVQFSLCRFFVGMSYDNCMIMTYLLVLEYVAPKYRTIIANLPFAIFYTLGATTLPWIALACGHWKTLCLATSIPMALSILAPFIIPESAQWLLSRGRIDDAVNKIITIGRVNKKEVPLKLIEQFKLANANVIKEKNDNVLNILKVAKLRKLFLSMCLLFMCIMCIFDALVRSLGALEFDFFISFTIVSFTEFPSLALISFILDATGRKWLTVGTLLICAIFCILSVFVGSGLIPLICAVVARFTVNMSSNITMQWAAEVLPTSVRGSGVSIIHICSYLGTFISPYIVYLKNYVTWLPVLVMGLIAILGACIAITLPETVGRDMPQTFEDAEKLIDNQKFFDIPCLIKKRKTDVGTINTSFNLSCEMN